MQLSDVDTLDWNKGDGLLPAIIQHSGTGQVLMLGYVNRDALRASIRQNKAVFYSRSRQTLWTKGETSGHTLILTGITTDCDRDAILMLAQPLGPTCHKGTTSCFPALAPALVSLQQTIGARLRDQSDNSYTAGLAQQGIRRCAQKVGEEGLEVALAAVAEDREAVAGEAADLLYHLLIVLRLRELGLEDVAAVLDNRRS